MRNLRPFLSLAVVVMALAGCSSIFGSDKDNRGTVSGVYTLVSVNGLTPAEAAAQGTLPKVVVSSELRLEPDAFYTWRRIVERRVEERKYTMDERSLGSYTVSARTVVLTEIPLPDAIRFEFQRTADRLRHVDDQGTVYEYAPAKLIQN